MCHTARRKACTRCVCRRHRSETGVPLDFSVRYQRQSSASYYVPSCRSHTFTRKTSVVAENVRMRTRFPTTTYDDDVRLFLSCTRDTQPRCPRLYVTHGLTTKPLSQRTSPHRVSVTWGRRLVTCEGSLRCCTESRQARDTFRTTPWASYAGRKSTVQNMTMDNTSRDLVCNTRGSIGARDRAR